MKRRLSVEAALQWWQMVSCKFVSTCLNIIRGLNRFMLFIIYRIGRANVSAIETGSERSGLYNALIVKECELQLTMGGIGKV